VDDSELIRFHLRLLLQPVPGIAIVHEAADVPDAIEAFGRIRPDVLVLDLQMPSGSGVEVLRHIRSRRDPCTTIVLSGALDAERFRACREAGADHCFRKVDEFDKVKEVITQLRAFDPAPRTSSNPTTSQRD
jgi:two-component system LytT family response regulator